MQKNRNIKGRYYSYSRFGNPQCSLPPSLPLYGRYIDQCQELLNASLREPPLPGDLEMYANAVRMAQGDLPGYWDGHDAMPPKEFVAYVERGGISAYLDGIGTVRKDPLPVTWNYERWLSSV